jgi:hypothetical protein
MLSSVTHVFAPCRELAKQMVETKDPAEADRLKEEIVRGFYGGEPHA